MKRALGYDCHEERFEESEKDGVKTIRITKHIPPDTTAGIFWLKNRNPDKWRQNPQPEGTAASLADIIDAAWKERTGR